jgi:hypothetical protein
MHVVEPGQVTAKKFARENIRFQNACKTHGVEPTPRQARAYLARRGRWNPSSPHYIRGTGY